MLVDLHPFTLQGIDRSFHIDGIPQRDSCRQQRQSAGTPYPIKAGDPVGHLGYFQVPTEDGHEKRYQVHIECLTTDDLPRFLSNPEGVGRDTPAFARCPKGIPVYLQFSGGEIQKGLVTTTSEAVMALSGQAVTDNEGKRYWPGGSSRGLLAESDVQLLSRYDLAGRGFETTEDSPASFDHLDGKTQPKGLVKTIFERFFNVADNDGKPYSKAVAFNYQQLLDKIDGTKSPHYNPEQYRRAVQNPSMRDHLYPTVREAPQRLVLLVGSTGVESVLYATAEKRCAGVVCLQHEIPDGHPLDVPCGRDGGKSMAYASAGFSGCDKY
ncbi:Phage-related lysozyme (muraminidase) [Salmonella enterica subsp. arizonae]|nr:Phage-related lysozyme (muraminidase) [Salmonella enterica subsp. arizonae]